MATTNITITLTTPNGVTVAQAIEWFTDQNGYQENVADPVTRLLIPNPETRAVFAKRRIAEYVKDTIKARRINEARNAVVITDDVEAS